MVPFKLSIRSACLAASVAAVLSCSKTPLAGWGSETTNGVTACVVRADGSPAAHAEVRLRPGDYLSPAAASAKPAIFTADAWTDDSGRFEITGIDAGAFRIEINDGRSALLLSCSLANNDTINLGVDTLRPYAAISGAIDSAGAPAYVRVLGLERLVRAGSDGHYALTDLPQADLDIRITINPGAPARPLEISHVKTVSGRTAAVWSSVNWPWSRRLYLNTAAAGVAADVHDFPLLVRLDSSNFDFTQTNGSMPAFRFTKEDRSSLPFEMESFSKQAKTAILRVALDTVYGNSTVQFITMSWNDSAQSRPFGARVFDTSRGYCGAWHLDEAGSGAKGGFQDATPLENSGAGGGPDSQTPFSISGIAGNGQMFDGRDDFIRVPNHRSLDFSDQLTVSFWFYYDSIQPYNARIISKDMDWDVKIASGRPQISVGGAYYSIDAPFQMKAWNHVAITLSGLSGAAVPAIYLNGRPGAALETTFPDSFNTADRDRSGDLFFGQLGDNAFFLHGALDEIWLQRSVRSAAWIALTYENQRPGGPFLENQP